MTETSSPDSVPNPELTGVLRIGELSRRTGVSDHLLRSWESRYGLLEPTRSAGGFRLYSMRDEQRVRAMKQLLDEGLSPAQAARIALSPEAQEQWTQTLSRAMLLEAQAAVTAQPTSTATPTSAPSPAQFSLSDATTPDPGAGLSAVLAGMGLVASPMPAAAAPLPAPLPPPLSTPDLLAVSVVQILESLASYDDQQAHADLDRLLADFAVETVLREVALPLLHQIGVRWSDRELTVAQEHFSSSWLRGRLNGLAGGWASGVGPTAVVASPQGELHDLAGMMFGIALHRQGWRVIHLGANTPIAAMDLGGSPRPDLVMTSALTPAPFDSGRAHLATLATKVGRVFLAGAGANPELAAATGCTYLSDDPITAAGRIARGEL